MDELIEDFLVETQEGLEELDNDLIALEQNPQDKDVIGKIFRVMHTIKGTCGFLGLSRLEKIAHAGEDIFDEIRDGNFNVTPEIISLVFESLDKIKEIMSHIEENEEEPDGDDSKLIEQLRACAKSGGGEVQSKAEEASEQISDDKTPEESSTDDGESSSAAIPQDSDELQKLFDETEPLVDVAQPDTNKEESKESGESQIGDSDELQKLFDETEPIAAVPSAEKDEKTTKEESKESGESQIGDSDELQKLFDETEPLVVEGEKKPETSEEPKESPKEAPKAAEKPKPPADDKTKKLANQSIRVNLEILEDLMQKASELVLTRNQLMQIMRQQPNSSFNLALQRLNGITTELQESVMKTRMQPIGNAWTKLPRIIRDLSVELDKKIDLKMSGEDTELDRHLLEAITDPLTHMIRNSADHGIESPKDRVAAGKPEVGTIELKAYHGGGYIIMEIKDDGKGIDPEMIKAKAIEKGLVSEDDAKNMNNSQILQFIFAPGFSTAQAITSVSGRGVGMDVVKNNIESISGTVTLESNVGEGSVFIIKIPLTLAIMPILQVAVNEQKFAIPQINVIEIVKVNSKSSIKIEEINNKPILRLRGELLPLVSLAEALELEYKILDMEDSKPQADIESEDIIKESVEQENDADENEESKENTEAVQIKEESDQGDEKTAKKTHDFIVVCEIGKFHFGIIVQEVFETEEIVVKPVAPILKDIEVYSGCTILGDGSVIMIIDPTGLAKSVGEITQNRKTSRDEDAEAKMAGEESSFIVFKAGDDTPKVIPLELISRLEEIDVSVIEYSRGMPIIQYRGDLMRVVKIDDNYQIPEEGIQEMLVLSNNDKIMGLVVEEILDIAKCQIKNQMQGGKNGYLGSVVINDKTCDVIDVSYFFKNAFADIEDSSPSKTVNQSMKVLLVDDSPFFRKFVPPELKNAGFDVMVCSSAKEAFDVLDTNPTFDAIVTDINMPGMNGDEFTQKCKKDDRFQSVPFIAMSSEIEEGVDCTKFADVGFAAFVSKTNHKAITEVLSSILSKEVA